MADGGLWAARAWFLLLGAGLLLVPLLPLDTVARAFAPPDLLLALTLAWVVRRPEALPVLLVAATFLLADLLFQRPPGLFAGLVVALSEWLRARAPRLRKGPLAAEWMAAGAGVALVTLADRLILQLVGTPQPRLGLTLIEVILTVAAYPLVAGLARLLLGRGQPDETLGRSL